MNKRIKKKQNKLNKDLKGIYFGLKITNDPLLMAVETTVDRKNSNSIILGTSGRGMSFYNKELLVAAKSMNCIVIDPKNDNIK